LKTATLKRRPKRDERAASTVTYAMVLPIFLLLIFGTFEIWRTISIRQSMERGAYRAARLLSQHRTPAWHNVAMNLAAHEVGQNAWLMSARVEDLQFVTTPGLSELVLLEPGDKLVVELRLPVPIGDLGLFDFAGEGTPLQAVLKAQCTTFVDLATPEWEAPDEVVAY